MKYFIFLVCWSQIDSDMCIVRAISKETAENKLKSYPIKPHHWTYIGVSYSIIK